NWRVLTGKVSYTTVVGAFYNAIDNMITSAIRPNSTVSSYFNLDTYKTQGITFNNLVNVGHLKFAVGFAYTGRYNQFVSADEALPEFTWSPEANASLGYEFPKAGIAANIFYK